MRRFAQFALLTALWLGLACRSSGTPADGRPRPRQDLLLKSELMETGATDAYEAVQRLRPRWLVVRSGMRSFSIETEVVVFDERLFLGTQDALRRIGIEGVYSIQYVDGATAKATLPGLGDRHVQGAIVVHRSPPDARDVPRDE